MLKALRTYTSVFRTFADASLKISDDFQSQMLVAQPAKLQKKIHYSKNPRWLHQDVKVAQKTIIPELNLFQLHEMAKQSFFNSSVENSRIHVERFCNECITRLGAKNFKRFVEFNENQVTAMKKISCFEKYIPLCFKLFNNDAFLLKLLVMCDLKSINRDNLSRIISQASLEADEKKTDDHLQIYKLIPNEKLIFDSYKNLEEIKNDEEKAQSEEECLTIEEISEISQRKFILDSILTFRQLPSESPKRTNWVYFQLESGPDEMLTEEGVMSAFNKLNIESCQNLIIFRAQAPVQKVVIPSTRMTSEDIKECLSKEIDFSRLRTLARSTRSEPVKKPEVEDEALTGDFSSHSSELEKDVKKFEEMIKFCSKVNNRNRDYGFAEFETFEDKEKLLNRFYRLFGIEYERAFLVVDDADNKKTIQLNNMNWNLNPKSFAAWLNQVALAGNSSMKFGFEAGLENFISDSSYFYLEMNSFPEALTMVQMINNSEYSQRKVLASFKRGCGRFVNGKLIENYISSNMEKQQKVHIERRTKIKEAYMKRIGDCLYQNYENYMIR